MLQNDILKALAENKKNQVIGGVVFNVPLTGPDIKPGLPFKELMREMKKAAKENLIRAKDQSAVY